MDRAERINGNVSINKKLPLKNSKKIVTIQPQIHPSKIIMTYGAGTDEHR